MLGAGGAIPWPQGAMDCLLPVRSLGSEGVQICLGLVAPKFHSVVAWLSRLAVRPEIKVGRTWLRRLVATILS